MQSMQISCIRPKKTKKGRALSLTSCTYDYRQGLQWCLCLVIYLSDMIYHYWLFSAYKALHFNDEHSLYPYNALQSAWLRKDTDTQSYSLFMWHFSFQAYLHQSSLGTAGIINQSS